ncbi:hypothetical protein ABIB25_002901 [Nakamurella sp. UYEF19]|uniref:hypothetical protein n=1 Tax=Nakamurella sp. UYEF19 TaxID=1756392 RepID=UPI003396BB70
MRQLLATGRLLSVIPDQRTQGSGVVVEPPAVTTLAQAARVAMDRTRRLTLLGQLPVVGVLVVPWLWPLHLGIVGLTAGHIRITPDASLSFHDGTVPQRVRPALTMAVIAGTLWLAGISGLILVCHGAIVVAVVAFAVLLPALIELIGLVEFAVLNPEWLTIKRQCGLRADGRTVNVLTSLVSRRDGHGHARVLMEATYPSWQAQDAVVVGYPASKDLISYYVRMGARRESPATAGGSPPQRRISFDCRRPLRTPSPDRADQSCASQSRTAVPIN